MAATDPDITPDTKDWTWVLDEACPECGFDTRRVEAGDIPDVVTANASAWSDVLAQPDVTVRPRPGVWSPLEYACHVRDVFDIFTRRLGLMLAEDDPLFDNWDQDATAIEDDYAAQDPTHVADQLVAAARGAAAGFAAVPDEAWSRTGRRSDGARFTVASLGRYFVHDPEHHLWDVRGSTAWTPRERPPSTA